MMPSPLTNPGVRFPPPTLFVGGWVIGWMLHRYVAPLPLTLIGEPLARWTGWSLIIIGLLLIAWGMVTFRLAHTAILPHRSASRLVTAGPYRFTRNPMYTGLTSAYVGLAALHDTTWPLIVLPLVLVALVRAVISREEAYLHDAFGAEYDAYQARVRRWL